MQKAQNNSQEGFIAVSVSRMGQDPTPVALPVGATVGDALAKAGVDASGRTEYFVSGIKADLGDILEDKDVLSLVTSKQASEWLAQLPEEADTDPCGARFTAYTANIAAGLIANHVKRLLLNQEVPSRIIYDAYTSTFLKID